MEMIHDSIEGNLEASYVFDVSILDERVFTTVLEN
jgi:hypothetical protein